MSGAAWRAMDRPGVGFGSDAEQIARAAALQIAQGLEAQCDLQETIWNARDQDWSNAMSRPYVPLRIARVPPERIFLGAQPSLVVGEQSRWDLWPAITVRCGTRGPSDNREQPDQYDSQDVQLIVEVLARAGPFKVNPADDRGTSDAVDSQYQRLTAAVIACIDVDRTLGNNVAPIKLPPRQTPSLPWVRKVDRGTGGFLCFQGMEIAWICTSLIY